MVDKLRPLDDNFTLNHFSTRRAFVVYFNPDAIHPVLHIFHSPVVIIWLDNAILLLELICDQFAPALRNLECLVHTSSTYHHHHLTPPLTLARELRNTLWFKGFLTDRHSGTPNSGISQLSTVANREGERGKIRPYGHMPKLSSASDSTKTLDAERADRISRLAGLERLATVRGAHQHLAQSNVQSQLQEPQAQGYFDQASQLHKSTVGSASATGSGCGSVPDSADKMSEEADDGVSSAAFSDDGSASLVGFGEAASSTLSGPISTTSRPPRTVKTSFIKPKRQQSERSGSPMEDIEEPGQAAGDSLASSFNHAKSTPKIKADGSMMSSFGAQEQAERIIDETMHDMEGNVLGSSSQARDLGRFSFEDKHRDGYSKR